MTERRPNRRGRGTRGRGSASAPAPDQQGEEDPYRDASEDAPAPAPAESPTAPPPTESAAEAPSYADAPRQGGDGGNAGTGGGHSGDRPPRRGQGGQQERQQERQQGGNNDGGDRQGARRGRRNRRGRNRGAGGGGGGGNEPNQQQSQHSGPPAVIVPDGVTEGWYDPARDAGFVRRATFSYLTDPGDAYVPPHVMREFGLRRGDKIVASVGRDHRGRLTVAEITSINDGVPADALKRPDFQTLTASYPERTLVLETGRPAKGGPELTRRAIDLIAPIGYGQRALIVAPARAGKTMLMQAITEGIAINHPAATLLILLVDERPEEVSEAISWGVGEVIASSFDQPAKRHVEVVEMVMERARRLVETGKDVVIVLDSLTRMARAFNTAERGTGRTLSGGLDSSAMARPKAFFGSARNILPEHGGGSLTIIATALVETGSRMDDVIFEEFKGTGNCEIKLDRSLSEKRIFPAFDIGMSGTRREEKLYRPGQLDAIYTLRRGLQQMPPQSGMEWLIKRIAGTTSNEALLAGL